MIFRALRDRCRDEYEFALRQAEMGLDTGMRLDDLPVRFAPEVKIHESVQAASAGEPAVITRVYETPAGNLTAKIRKVEGWPFGDRLPLFSDHIVPRAVKHPIAEPSDLEPLRYLLMPPADDDIKDFLAEGAKRKRFAESHGFLLTGGWRGERQLASEEAGLIGREFGTISVIDTLMWLCGGTAPVLWAYDEPDFLRELIALVEQWNRKRLAVHLQVGVDLVFRRAWYEGTDFWSPSLYREFILPSVKRDVEFAHQAGARYAYIITSGMAPVADLIIAAGVDVIVGIDPGQGKGTSLPEVRRALGGKVALWGGASGPLVVEEGTEEEVRAAVEEAVSVLGPTGRFILSPVDNIRADTERSWRNVAVFIDTWRSWSARGRR
jgi:hypothetical protein